jgi:hypothetical protein
MSKSKIRNATMLAIFLSSAMAFAATYSSIQKMSGWQSCTSCAGGSGSATLSMLRYVNPPSLDGASAQFNLGGSTPYSNALWWKQLGANSSAHNFTYDLYFYLKAPSYAQALEFDVNQSVGGKKYIFGTECDVKWLHVWQIYDSYDHRWVPTNIGCSMPTAYTWHHLTLEFQRTSGGQASFVSVTLDGAKHYFNKVYSPQGSSVNEINFAFQMDGDKYQHHYSTWLDKVSLTY